MTSDSEFDGPNEIEEPIEIVEAHETADNHESDVEPVIKAIVGIRVAGFKAIPPGVNHEGFALRLSPITMLYGQNSVGKSSLLEALEVFSDSLATGELCLSCLRNATFSDVVHGKDARDQFLIGLTFSVVNPTDSTWPAEVEVEVSLLFAKTGVRSLTIIWRTPEVGAVLREIEFARKGNGPFSLFSDGIPRGSRSYPNASQNLGAGDVLGIVPLCSKFLGPLRHIEPVRPSIPDFLPNSAGSLGADLLLNKTEISRWLTRLYPHHSLLVSEIDTGLGADEQLIALRISDSRSVNTHMKLSEVGSGVTQALPCIVACLQDRSADPAGVLLLEQPELHLNARSQVELGSLLQESIGLNNMLIVETHSEYLMIRLQSLVRSGALLPSAVVIYESLKPGVENNGELFVRHDFLADGTIDPPLVEDFLDVFESDRINYPGSL